MSDASVQSMLEEQDDVKPLVVTQKRRRIGQRTIAAQVDNLCQEHPAHQFTELFAALADLLSLVTRRDYDPRMSTAAQRYKAAIAGVGCRDAYFGRRGPAVLYAAPMWARPSFGRGIGVDAPRGKNI